MKKFAALLATSLVVVTLALPPLAFAHPTRLFALHAPLRSCMTQLFDTCQTYCPANDECYANRLSYGEGFDDTECPRYGGMVGHVRHHGQNMSGMCAEGRHHGCGRW
ncbi:hypothetical protein AALA21_02540 [Eggerthellaceae bacterium 3-80]|nr:hypothetical protein D7W09_07890 [bacterium D16-34]